MSSSTDKAKKLKYLGVQFITIDDPVLEQSRLALNGQRSNSSCARFSAHNSKSNIDSLQHYPGLEKSNELFTKDEISEINYCISLGKDSNNVCRFKPTSKLSLLKQVSQSLHEKNDYNESLTQEENSDLNLFEPNNQKNNELTLQLNPPSTPLTRCDSLISNQDEDDTEYLIVSTRRSQISTPSNHQGSNNSSTEDIKGNKNAALTQGEIQNQIWLYAHDTPIQYNFDDLDESKNRNISARSLPNNARQNITSNNNNKDNNLAIKKSISAVDKTGKKDDNNTIQNNQKTEINNINKDIKETNNQNTSTSNDINKNATTNNNANKSNEASNNNNNRLLNYQNKKKNQVSRSSLQERYFTYLNGKHVQPINGSIVNGKTQLNLNTGEKRLKKIIEMSSPKETISPDFKTPSILKKSYCARRIHQYLKDSAIPLPTFLQEEENSDS